MRTPLARNSPIRETVRTRREPSALGRMDSKMGADCDPLDLHGCMDTATLSAMYNKTLVGQPLLEASDHVQACESCRERLDAYEYARRLAIAHLANKGSALWPHQVEPIPERSECSFRVTVWDSVSQAQATSLVVDVAHRSVTED